MPKITTVLKKILGILAGFSLNIILVAALSGILETLSLHHLEINSTEVFIAGIIVTIINLIIAEIK